MNNRIFSTNGNGNGNSSPHPLIEMKQWMEENQNRILKFVVNLVLNKTPPPDDVQSTYVAMGKSCLCVAVKLMFDSCTGDVLATDDPRPPMKDMLENIELAKLRAEEWINETFSEMLAVLEKEECMADDDSELDDELDSDLDDDDSELDDEDHEWEEVDDEFVDDEEDDSELDDEL